MLAQAAAELPNECCGLLAGLLEQPAARVTRRYPLVNAAASPKEYTSDPRSMFEAVRDMHRHGLEILAIYHSHPTSEPVPSRTDLERNYSADVMSLIISLASSEPTVRAWWLRDDGFTEADWIIV